MNKLAQLFSLSLSIAVIAFSTVAIGTGIFGTFNPPISAGLNIACRSVMIFSGMLFIYIWWPRKQTK